MHSCDGKYVAWSDWNGMPADHMHGYDERAERELYFGCVDVRRASQPSQRIKEIATPAHNPTQKGDTNWYGQPYHAYHGGAHTKMKQYNIVA